MLLQNGYREQTLERVDLLHVLMLERRRERILLRIDNVLSALEFKCII